VSHTVTIWRDYLDLAPIQLEMLDWAKENCPSFITNDAVDCSDFDSSPADFCWTFDFDDEQDAAFFKLRWV
jgi:hypothetical protein